MVELPIVAPEAPDEPEDLGPAAVPASELELLADDDEDVE